MRFAVVMGRRAASAIGMAEADFRPLHRQMVEGVDLCTVWDIAEIAEQPARVDELVRCLHEAFRQLGL